MIHVMYWQSYLKYGEKIMSNSGSSDEKGGELVAIDLYPLF